MRQAEFRNPGKRAFSCRFVSDKKDESVVSFAGLKDPGRDRSPSLLYSYLSATSGSTLVARRAGTAHARRDTAASRNAPDAKIVTPTVCTP